MPDQMHREYGLQRRSPVYERIERECGHKAMVIVKERVGLEVVRMRLLKEGKRAVTD
jgi:hypothetical protein